ncbi:MAG: glycoside hydrolase family 3 protein [Spirochaetes bacterium]|nr:glycoside hydrolase family 3 protein [Spirochaetota bacterium]
MTDEEILGQILLVGYSSVEPTPLLLEWIRSRGIGGVKIFGWNAEDLSRLYRSIQQMQEHSKRSRMKLPLFIATDQEGGWVRHVKGDTAITPGNLALGATRIPFDAYRTGYLIGKELKMLGINMNFAPTVDVYVNPEANVIGPRAFSSDPVLTGILGVAYYRGMAEAGIICAAKHYPGHGNADEDSHGVLPVIHDSFDTLWKRDLIPYRMLISEGIPAILSGHLSFPKITGDNRPSSLSPFFGTELLRKRLGFEGLLITDDLYMSGANRGKTMADVCIEAIDAGNDLLLLSKTPQLEDPIWRAIVSRYHKEKAFRDRVLSAVRRVVGTKIRYIHETERKTLDTTPIQVATPESREFFLEQSARSVTLLKNHLSLIPYSPSSEERVLLAGPFKDFLRTGKTYFPKAEEFAFSYSPFYRANPEEKKAFQRVSTKVDTIIFCLANPNGLELLRTLKDFKGKIIVFSILTPVYLREVPWVQTAIAVYGWSIDSFKAGFAVITGSIPPLGKNPIETLLSEKTP